MKPFSSASVDTDVFLRACGILLVVINHSAAIADRPFELGGGMNILLLLSGLSFARFTLAQSSMSGVRASMLQFGWKLLLPALAVILLSFALKREFSWPELLFVSNFYSLEHVALLYTWYPQIIVQMIAFLYLATFVPGAISAFRTRPIVTATIWTVATYAVFILHYSTYGPDEFHSRLLSFYMWNFVLGWLVYFVGFREPGVLPAGRLAAFLLIVALAAWAFAFGDSWLRMVTMTIATFLLFTRRKIRMPKLFAQTANVLSQATFTIFLTHVFFLRAFDTFHLRRTLAGADLRDMALATSITLVGTVAVWLSLTSLHRAWRYVVANDGDLDGRPLPA